jgi:hypothetical protein
MIHTMIFYGPFRLWRCVASHERNVQHQFPYGPDPARHCLLSLACCVWLVVLEKKTGVCSKNIPMESPLGLKLKEFPIHAI